MKCLKNRGELTREEVRHPEWDEEAIRDGKSDPVDAPIEKLIREQWVGRVKCLPHKLRRCIE